MAYLLKLDASTLQCKEFANIWGCFYSQNYILADTFLSIANLLILFLKIH